MIETDARPVATNAGLWKVITLPRIHHELGDLCFGEAKRHIPFEIARFFYIFDIPAHATRGSHAHKSISQVIFALRGAFSINLDNGQERQHVRLEHPERGLLVGPMVWKGISDYEDGSLCLVMASGYYDENEYLRNRTDWVAELEGKR